MSIREIAKELGVSRSSVSVWVRDIELSTAHVEGLRRRNPRYDASRNGAAANSARALKRHVEAQDEGRRRAREGDGGYAAGCMLYWAEGSRAKGSVRFANSDPEMLRFFADFLRKSFGVADERMRVSCNLFADDRKQAAEIEAFWLQTLNLPLVCLRASTVNHYSPVSLKKRLNALPYGTCHLAVHDTWLVHVIHGSIQELAGFRRAAWLRL
jgi:hypothetical protein